MEFSSFLARPKTTAVLAAFVFFVVTWHLFPNDAYPSWGSPPPAILSPTNTTLIAEKDVLQTAVKALLPWLYFSPWVISNQYLLIFVIGHKMLNL